MSQSKEEKEEDLSLLTLVKELYDKNQATAQRKRKKRPPCAQVSSNSRCFARLKDHPEIKKNLPLRCKSSKDPHLTLKHGHSSARKRVRLVRPVSPALSSVSSVSVKSDWSMEPPLTFKHAHRSTDQRKRKKRPPSARISSNSRCSAWLKDHPEIKRNPPLRCKRSKDPPLTLKHGHSPARTRVRLVRAVSPALSSVSSVSITSDRSMEPPVEFKYGGNSADERC